jgi:hypothetical protein
MTTRYISDIRSKKTKSKAVSFLGLDIPIRDTHHRDRIKITYIYDGKKMTETTGILVKNFNPFLEVSPKKETVPFLGESSSGNDIDLDIISDMKSKANATVEVPK